jgi:hypothetical protein
LSRIFAWSLLSLASSALGCGGGVSEAAGAEHSLAANGRVLAQLNAAYRGFGDISGGLLLISEDAQRAAVGAAKLASAALSWR